MDRIEELEAEVSALRHLVEWLLQSNLAGTTLDKDVVLARIDTVLMSPAFGKSDTERDRLRAEFDGWSTFITNDC